MAIVNSNHKLEKTREILRYEYQDSAYKILANARAAATDLEYAGDLSPRQAWQLVSTGIAELIDVRTQSELDRVGFVPGTKHVEWLRNADRLQNPQFINELKRKVGKNEVILFLCRSGIRSVAAADAATQAGFPNAFNILEGFEGDGNPQHGWLNQCLPSTDK